MNFLPENKKRALWSVIVLVLAVGGIILVYTLMSVPASSPAATTGGVATSGGQNLTGPLLPYGLKIDAAVLNDPVFKSLRPVPELTVTSTELGKPDLFSL